MKINKKKDSIYWLKKWMLKYGTKRLKKISKRLLHQKNLSNSKTEIEALVNIMIQFFLILSLFLFLINFSKKKKE